MVDDDYEILPHGELEYLRKEVEKLKKNPFGNTETGQTLLDAINALSTNINKLNSILESANDEMIRDYEETKSSDRIDRMMEQNEKLAEGMVAIGRLIKDVQEEQKRSSALRGGFSEVSSFSTNVAQLAPAKGQAKIPAPKTLTKNPFQEKEITLDTTLPRQSFMAMDPEELPSLKGLPPPPKGLAPITDVPKPQ